MTTHLPALPASDISSLIGTIYDSALERPQWDSFLKAFHAKFPRCAIAIAGFDGEIGKPVFSHAGFDPDYIEVYRSNAELLNDTVRFMIGWDVGEVNIDSETVPAEVYKNLTLVKDWLNPQGFGPSTAAVLARQEGRFIALNLGYPIGEEEALRPAVDGALRMLVPHIVRAIEISRIVAASSIVASSLKGLLDNIKLPMMVVDKTCQFQFANPSGQALLERGAILRRNADGRVAAGTSDITATLRDRVRQTAADEVTHGLQIGDGSEGLVVCMVPLTSGGEMQSHFDTMLYGHDGRVGLLIGQRSTAAPSIDLLSEVYGLSGEEARACSLLLSGRSPDDIAETLGKSPRTIRNQIQSVYAKLGVTSQMELADAVGVFRVFGASFTPPGLPH